MQVAIQSTNVVKVLKLLIIVTLAFAFTAMAQESGNSSVANAAAVTAPANQFLFAPLGNVSNNPFSEYRIHSTTGALTVVNKALTGAIFNEFSFRDPKHRFLYIDGTIRTSNFTEDGIAEYRVITPTNGGLARLSGSPFDPNGQRLAFVTIRPDLKFAYIQDFDNVALVHIVTMNPTTGALVKEVATVTIAIGNGASSILNLQFDPTGRFLYIVNAEANLIDAYVSNATTGALTEVRGAPFVPRGSAHSQCPPPDNFCGGAVAISGNFLYYVSLLFDGISEFKINQTTGALAELPSSPASNPAHKGFSLLVTPDGKHLYVDAPEEVAGQSFLLGYTIHSTGALTPVPGSPFKVPGASLFMDMDVSGNYLYTTAGDFIVGFRIHPTTGGLSPVPGSPYSAPGATGLTIIH
jgi:6-phosphogluconolactonase (cycloisomerase 2 family)